MSEPHYYECHIVVDRHWQAQTRQVGHQFGFWGGEITKDDGGDDEAGNYFLTTRDTDLEALKARMVRCLEELSKSYTVKVRRYKIEAAVVDSHHDASAFKIKEF